MDYIPIWNDSVPFYTDEYISENIQNENCPTLSPFLCDSSDGACVIVVPGGGYTHRASGKKEKVCEVLRKSGINAFMLNYRVTPYRYPVPLIDCKRAIRFLYLNADKYNIDKNNISIMGFSAGAHLVACSLLCDDPEVFEKRDETDMQPIKVSSAALCYPVISLCADYAHKGSGEAILLDDEAQKKKYCIENMDLLKMPPVFMWHTFEDKSVSVYNSIEMAKRLKYFGIETEYHIFPKGRHGSALAEDIPGTCQWMTLYKNWLKRTTGANIL